MRAFRWKGTSHELTAYTRGDYVGLMLKGGIKESKVSVSMWRDTKYVQIREETIVLK